ncbi:MAG: hypothetical protein AAF657_02440 [Acidobacteriota bacterium]
MPGPTRCLLVGILIASMLGTPATAQNPPISLDSVFVYSVKVVCTTNQIPIRIATSVSAAGELLSGAQEELSRTAVNIQNPLDRAARFSYRAVQPRTGASPGGTFTPVNEPLVAFAARSLDCSDFIALQQNPPPSGLAPATEGFLVIESRSRLQVAAVYTQRVVKEGLKDDISTTALLAGKKNVFRGGKIPDLEDIPLTPIPAGPSGSPVLSESSGVAIPIEQFGNGPVQGAAMGIGLGVGVGRGIGFGIGAGGGIDVEYVEPIIVPRRPVLIPVPRPGLP